MDFARRLEMIASPFRSKAFQRLRKLSYRSLSRGNVENKDVLIHELTDTASLYIHWPFCKHICPYCNFNKYKSQNVDEKRMERCLRKALNYQIKMFNISKINSIFFGGGTPSLCEPETIEHLINDVHKKCSVRNNLEVSLEANPASHDLHKLRSFKSAGISRLSIGVQALNDKDLSILGRDHSVEDAVNYINEANKHFGNRISIDLMFGRPGQTLESWQKELKMALELSDLHISLYQLTMERSTPMEKMHRRGELILPQQDVIGDMYSLAVEHLERAGLKRYEVANFAREGHESQHNMSYWGGQQYIGIGPGAHGRAHEVEQRVVRRSATVQTLVPGRWMEQVERESSGMVKMAKLTTLETLEEILLQGMRTQRGVSQEVFGLFSGEQILLEDLKQYASMKQMLEDDFLEIDNRGIRATSKGLGVLDSLMTDVCLSMQDLINEQN